MNRRTYFDFENATSIWQGQLISPKAEKIFWVLTFHADAPVPSVHGAMYRGVDSGAKCTSAEMIHVLKGTWNREKREVVMREIYPPRVGADNEKIGWQGIIEEQKAADDSVVYCMKGSRFYEHKKSNGTVIETPFACCMDLEAAPSCGFWVGKAEPDPTLREQGQYIPTNPIAWSLALLPSGGVIGAGFFDDSGDVPDQPVLNFVLAGSWDVVSRKLNLKKVYEKAAGDWEVDYEGTLESAPSDENGLLSGKWKNTAGASHGRFVAKRHGMSVSHSAAPANAPAAVSASAVAPAPAANVVRMKGPFKKV